MPGCTRSTLLSSTRTRPHVNTHTQTFEREPCVPDFGSAHLSVSLPPLHISLSFFTSHANVHVSVWFAHTEGSLSLAYCRHWVMIGLLRRQGLGTTRWRTSTPVSQCGLKEKVMVDLPSFDVVQESDFNVHQEWQQRYLWVRGTRSTLDQLYHDTALQVRCYLGCNSCSVVQMWCLTVPEFRYFFFFPFFFGFTT